MRAFPIWPKVRLWALESHDLALTKLERGRYTPEEDLNQAIRQIVSGAITPGGVIDVFEAAGLQKPDISLPDSGFSD